MKDRLAVSNDLEAEVLRQEAERLEQEIENSLSSHRRVRSVGAEENTRIEDLARGTGV